MERRADICAATTSDDGFTCLQGQVEPSATVPWMVAPTQALVERRHSSEPVTLDVATLLSSPSASALAHSRLHAQLLVKDGSTPTIFEWRNRPQLRQQFWACLRCAVASSERSNSARRTNSAHHSCRFLVLGCGRDLRGDVCTCEAGAASSWLLTMPRAASATASETTCRRTQRNGNYQPLWQTRSPPIVPFK